MLSKKLDSYTQLMQLQFVYYTETDAEEFYKFLDNITDERQNIVHINTINIKTQTIEYVVY